MASAPTARGGAECLRKARSAEPNIGRDKLCERLLEEKRVTCKVWWMRKWLEIYKAATRAEDSDVENYLKELRASTGWGRDKIRASLWEDGSASWSVYVV